MLWNSPYNIHCNCLNDDSDHEKRTADEVKALMLSCCKTVDLGFQFSYCRALCSNNHFWEHWRRTWMRSSTVMRFQNRKNKAGNAAKLHYSKGTQICINTRGLSRLTLTYLWLLTCSPWMCARKAIAFRVKTLKRRCFQAAKLGEFGDTPIMPSWWTEVMTEIDRGLQKTQKLL